MESNNFSDGSVRNRTQELPDSTLNDCVIEKGVVHNSDDKRKKSKNKPHRQLSENPNSFELKPKEKKNNKSIPDKNIDNTSSRVLKGNKNQKKVSSEPSLDDSSYASKMSSSANMRKSFNRQMSLPSESCAVPGFQRAPSSKSPKPSKRTAKSPSSSSKGASGYTPVRKNNPAKRGIKFDPYIPLSQIQQGLKRGEFIEGALRINPRNYEDAYVSVPDGKMDIYIGGMHNRNRALNGDIVVVQINPKQEWKILCDAIKDYQERSGRCFVDTICEPTSPVTPCKVHTPDPFVKPLPFSSNSWDAARGQRSSDTLEILGIDKIAQQLNDMSVRPKNKQKSKKHSSCEGPIKSEASLSQDSSEECVDKLSPQLTGNKSNEGNASVAASSSKDLPSNLVAEQNVDSISTKSLQLNKRNSQDKMNTKEFSKEDENKKDKWLDNENSVNIVISPDELLQIDGNSLLTHSSLYEDHSVDSLSDEDAIIVPPGDLSGEDFTDSASLDSNTDHLENMIEDSEFLACNQDAQNNNIEYMPQNVEMFNYSNYQSDNIHSSTTLTSTGVDAQCKIQFNKSVPSVMSMDSNSEVVLSEISEVLPPNHLTYLQQNLVSESQTASSALKSEIASNKTELALNDKKRRHRKRKKKVKPDKIQSVSEKISEIVKTFNDIHNLTVDQIMEHPEWTRFVQKTGKVVHILERKHSSLAVGHIRLLPDKNVKWALFSPNDSRVPRMLIPMSDCPQNFYHRSQDFSNVLFLAQIQDWDDNCTYASGQLVKELGNEGDISVETEGILVENGVDFQEFDEEVLACLPLEESWTVPARELDRRRDFRNECVFTIDPSTARDMDDAVSCVLLKNGNYEVGVHIADVSYFVQDGTKLDEIASQRATSVYLVHKVIPMLPRKLCDDLCSLTPGEERLTFSVVWEMSPEGEVFSQWIGRSVIKSCVKLSYEHAQDMIENPSRVWNESEHPPMYGNFNIYDISKRVNELHSIAFKLRAQRFMEGALHLDQVKLQFALNPENGLPSGFNMYVQRDSNKLIEEFMLLANMTVAAKIYSTFPSLSLLRRHPPPDTKPMQDVITACETVGVVLDASSSGSLQTSIARYKRDDFTSMAMVQVLMNICSKPMNCAVYFCTGVLEDTSMYRHYALNVPLYTHFTSPIRRYPDIIVHRLLGAALSYNPVPGMKPVEMQKCASHCNDKKYNAKKVSEMSSEMFLAAFIQSLGSICAKAMVVGVMDHSFDCLILEMGMVKRVYCDKLPLVKKEFTKLQGLSYLNLTWKDDHINEGIKQTIVMFTLVDVVMMVEKESFQIKVMLTKPGK